MEGNEALGILYGEGAQDNLLEEGENGGVRADAQSQGKHGHAGDQRVAAQGAKREAEIVQHGTQRIAIPRPLRSRPFAVHLPEDRPPWCSLAGNLPGKPANPNTTIPTQASAPVSTPPGTSNNRTYALQTLL